MKGNVLVVIPNPEKADLDLLADHRDNGDGSIVLLLDHDGDPKSNSKFAKFLDTLGKAHRAFPAEDKPWKAEQAAIDFCLDEARRAKKRLDGNLAKALVGRTGTDFGVLSFEILKMVALADSMGSDDLTAQIISGAFAPLTEASLQPLVDALAAKDRVRICRVLDRVKKTTKGDPTMKVCGLCRSQALTWLTVADLRDREGKTPNQIADDTRTHPWFFKTHVYPRVRLWSRSDVARLIRAVAASERAVLNGHVDPWVGLKVRLLEVCG
jgi:DNA polymerase III delta subunit